jgi:hypothetical protein
MRFRHVNTFPVERLAVFLVLLWFGECSDVDPIVDRYFRFVAFRINLELMRLIN